MRMREPLAGALLTLLALIQMSATTLLKTDPMNGACPNSEACPNPEEGGRRVPERYPNALIPEPSALVRKDEALTSAYYDTMNILGGNNQCSMFFGGSEASIHVFSNFMDGIRKDFLPSSVGLKMSGDYINVLNAETKLKYRIFEKASLNSGGPFYRRRTSATGMTISGVGSFPPNSREARVLMLLHELGHLMKGADQKWLLPDDGNNMADSLKNTRKIESVCGYEIRSLNKQEAGLPLARQNNSEQTVSPAAATSSHQ